MLRKLLFLLLLVFTATSAFSQDTIFRINREKIVAKIQEVGPAEIRYKRYAAPDGPQYVIKKTEVWKIVYSDGTKEAYHEPEMPAGAAGITPGTKFAAGFNVFDMLTGTLTVKGQYAFNSHYFLDIPVSVGVNALFHKSPAPRSTAPRFFYYSKDKLFSLGADACAKFSTSWGMEYFFGLTTEYGQVRWLYEQSYYVNLPNYPYYYWQTQAHEQTYWYIATGLKGGVILHPVPRLGIMIDGAMGMEVNDYLGARPMARLGVSFMWQIGNEIQPAK